MQLLASKGYEEKETEGLNLIEAEVKKVIYSRLQQEITSYWLE